METLNDLEHVKAAALACQIPLQRFLGSMTKFETELGVWSVNKRSFNLLGKRLQWVLAFEKDVAKIRLILAAHAAIMTLHMNVQIL